VISQAAMRSAFVKKSKLVSKYNNESLTAGWGDALVANMFMQSSIYLEERYSHHFNGESPRLTKAWPDRFCTPIVSFHGLGRPEEMIATGNLFKDITKPVSWVGIWELYASRALNSFIGEPFRIDWDHVGRLDESTTTTNDVKTKEACLRLCLASYDHCLAWTWEAESRACHVSPWIIVGNAAGGKFTGINTRRVMMLAAQCP